MKDNRVNLHKNTIAFHPINICALISSRGSVLLTHAEGLPHSINLGSL